jgi:DNA-binding Lrp family transcriptional regulator
MSRDNSRFIIGELQRGGPRTVEELAEAGQVSRSAVRNRISELAAAGSVERQGDYPPYRYVLVSDTAPVAEAFLRRALDMLLTGHDPIAEVSAALAVLTGQGTGGTPVPDMGDLRDWAAQIIEEEGPEWLTSGR